MPSSEDRHSDTRSAGISRKLWLALSVANVWACGVGCEAHDWGMAAAGAGFALAAWWASSIRVMALFAPRAAPTPDACLFCGEHHHETREETT